MRRVLRILGYAGLSLVAVVLVAYGVLYTISTVKLRRIYAITPHTIRVPHDSVSISEGGRFAKIRGCTTCHGQMLEGQTLLLAGWSDVLRRQI
jgi:hypothetical protein